MTIHHKTTGTCSTAMHIEVEDGTIRALEIENGCNGNLQGICRLVAGMEVAEVIRRLEGIRCGDRPTSCPDQLALALRQTLS